MASKNYRYKGDVEAFVPDLNATVQPGQVVKSEIKLSGAFEEVKSAPTNPKGGSVKSAPTNPKGGSDAATQTPA